ncbi:MAG: discoidin domain-containing protein [Chloroflexota bacterium]
MNTIKNIKSTIYWLSILITFYLVFLITTKPITTQQLAAQQALNSTIYYVAPTGRNIHTGLNAQKPLRTIQRALGLAQPGDRIVLARGEYRQDFHSVRHGTEGEPITITGPVEAIVRGAGRSHVVDINHDYHVLEGFTIDGHYATKNRQKQVREKLLFVQGTGIRQGVIGLRVLSMTLRHAGGECLRLRYFVQESEIAHSNIMDCGIHDFVQGGTGKNGEGIYIGTSSKQWADGTNPTADPDDSSRNWIHHNTIDTQGGECIEVKEGASDNIVEHNTCTGQQDGDSAGLNVRGNGNIVRYNKSTRNLGAGIRLGGDRVNGVQYGRDNAVYYNELTENRSGGIKILVAIQEELCGNEMIDNVGNETTGRAGRAFEPTAPCPFPHEAKSTTPIQSAQPQSPLMTPTKLPTSSNETTKQRTLNRQSLFRLPILSVTASHHDGNGPMNTVDRVLETRWSAKNTEETQAWIMYNLGNVYPVAAIELAFFQGDNRVAAFTIETSVDGKTWDVAYQGESSGGTLALVLFPLGDVHAQYVRFIGHGNTNNQWNSLTEVAVLGDVTTFPSSSRQRATATPLP